MHTQFKNIAPTSKQRFCSRCAGTLITRSLPDDNRARLMCTRCGQVHYENPKMLVACFVSCGHSVLLCRRALAPGYGLWALPAGFVEAGETLEQAAARETLEETGVVIEPQQLAFYGTTALLTLGQVYISYRARVPLRHSAPGNEALQTAFFTEHELPWEQLAFPQIAKELRTFFIELKSGTHGTHSHCIA